MAGSGFNSSGWIRYPGVQTLLSEIGTDMEGKWKTSNLTSPPGWAYLRNRKTGNKVIHTKTKKTNNRANLPSTGSGIAGAQQKQR